MTKRITESGLRKLIREELDRDNDDVIGNSYYPDSTGGYDYSEVTDPSTPESALRDLAYGSDTSSDSASIVDAACDPMTTPEELTQLSDNSDSYVRMCVAENPNTPQVELVKLSYDNDRYVRSAALKKLRSSGY